MANDKKSGMKSAFDLAMERLEKRDGKLAPLSLEQKKAIAEVDNKAKAKTAEVEIMFQQKLQDAFTGGKPEEIEEVERQKRSEIDRIRRHAEEDKDRIRQGRG
ncbi:MAG: hypothetical protein NTY53_23575 [Kiritimatiellaeota bacterium]|nr:hypothetical protein [Kiritimatiellota bacterium]